MNKGDILFSAINGWVRRRVVAQTKTGDATVIPLAINLREVDEETASTTLQEVLADVVKVTTIERWETGEPTPTDSETFWLSRSVRQYGRPTVKSAT